MKKPKSTKLPLVSVVMSAYNAEKYIKEAIDSILGQTFTDFEFIIIDDGSTDDTLKIIKNYKDPRIVLISRENKGLVASLNEGIERARGKYIARMDADDISMPERFAKQVEYMAQHPEVVLAGARIRLIDYAGEYIGVWPTDIENTSTAEIAKKLVEESCVAHPTFFIKSEILKKYMYNEYQVAGEDYDLLMRLVSDGQKISKLTQTLLSYRIHSQSITQVSNSKSANKKLYKLKIRFLFARMIRLQFNEFDRRLSKKVIRFLIATVKNKIKHYISMPFRWFFDNINRRNIKIWLNNQPNTKDSRKKIAFIIPWLTMGGADKVIIDLVTNFNKDHYNIYIITTNKEHKNIWLDKLQDKNIQLIDIAEISRTSNVSWAVGQFCNIQKINTVIISNSKLGYEAIPYMKTIRIIDIVHGQSGWIDQGGAPSYSEPYKDMIDLRVAVSEYMAKYLTRVYSEDKSKIKVIPNGIDLEQFLNIDKVSHKGNNLLVTWIGRLSFEKRPDIFVDTAAYVLKNNKTKINYRFCIAGDGALSKDLHKQIKKLKIQDKVSLLGPVADIPSLLGKSDIVAMTSEMEGLPIALIEAQAAGRPIVAIDVGGISEIVNNETGVLVDPFVIDLPMTIGEEIINLCNDQKEMSSMSFMAKKNASKKFNVKKMAEQYEKII